MMRKCFVADQVCVALMHKPREIWTLPWRPKKWAVETRVLGVFLSREQAHYFGRYHNLDRYTTPDAGAGYSVDVFAITTEA